MCEYINIRVCVYIYIYHTHYTYINIKILEMIVTIDATITDVRERTGEKKSPYALETSHFLGLFSQRKPPFYHPIQIFFYVFQ